MKNVIRAFTIGLFALVILCPFLQEHLQLLHYQSLTENRFMKPRPSNWQTLFQTGSVFAKDYEEYFNDNYGMRDLLIRTKNQLDYMLLHESDKVVIGHDGFLFYKSVVERDEINAERASAEAWRVLQERILNLNRALAKRGTTLVIMPCPMKNSIYPEMLPASAPHRPVPTAFDRFRRILSEHPEVVTVDTAALLAKLKESMPVYHKTDFHWNDPAGAHMAKELVNRLGIMSGKGNLWDQPISIRIDGHYLGGEAQALGLLMPILENALFLRSDLIRAAPGEFSYTEEANEWTYTSRLEDVSRLIPSTVMFGDSYADAFTRAGFIVYFARFQKFFNWDFSKRYSRVPAGTRFLVIQFTEPVLAGLLNTVFWPDEFVGGTSIPVK